jgi:Variant UBP zinc finger
MLLQVYKEECAFSFATPLAPDGLFLNMKTWQSYSKQFLELDRSRTGNALYLWEKWHKVGCDAFAVIMNACCADNAKLSHVLNGFPLVERPPAGTAVRGGEEGCRATGNHRRHSSLPGGRHVTVPCLHSRDLVTWHCKLAPHRQSPAGCSLAAQRTTRSRRRRLWWSCRRGCASRCLVRSCRSWC